MGGFFSQFFTLAKDTIFPVFCLSCDREGAWMCDKCLTLVPLDPQWRCPACHAPRDGGVPCSELCRSKSPLDAAAALFPFREDTCIGSMIHALKYKYAEELAEVFQRITADFLEGYAHYAANADIVMPIPLHRRRYAERGFNQAELLARNIAIFLDRPCRASIRRHKATKQQALLGREERITNVQDAFSVTEDVRGASILLIDDVFTTGSTMQECARALKNAGTRSVLGLTIARG